MKPALKPENIAQLVFFIRGEKVMLAQHLAELYGVPVRVLNQAVKRNIKRFPADFPRSFTFYVVHPFSPFSANMATHRICKMKQQSFSSNKPNFSEPNGQPETGCSQRRTRRVFCAPANAGLAISRWFDLLLHVMRKPAPP